MSEMLTEDYLLGFLRGRTDFSDMSDAQIQSLIGQAYAELRSRERRRQDKFRKIVMASALSSPALTEEG